MKMLSGGLGKINIRKGHTNMAINILTVSRSNPLNMFQGKQKGRCSAKLTRPVSCGWRVSVISMRIDSMGVVHTIHQSRLQLSGRDGSGSIQIYVRKPLPKLWISPNWWAVMLSVTAMSCRLATSILPRWRSMVRLVPRLIVVVHVGTRITAECNVMSFIAGGCATPKAGQYCNSERVLG